MEQRRRHPAPRADIPISLEIYKQLISASFSTGFKMEDWEIAAEAIDEWVRRHNPEALGMPATAGYQWKRLFLPTGTILRTVLNGKNHHCLVDGDRIVYDGKAVSPSGFVNAVGGIRRNAWKCSWILFPKTTDWKLADTLRPSERPRRARKPPATARPAPAPQPPTPRAPPAVPASTASEARQSQYTVHDQDSRTNSSGAARSWQPHPDIITPPERRADGDDRFAALLRKELLPILYRICGIEASHMRDSLEPL